jgi:hypothetical protein
MGDRVSGTLIPMDALTLAQQIVDVVRKADLDLGRVHSAFLIAKELLIDEGIEEDKATRRESAT